MAGFKKLQVNLLSPTGELLNCVSCFGGQISVFRAVTQGALEPYQRALLGMPGPERFSLSLDGVPFHPSDHNHIGFGEQFVPPSNSVHGFLVDSGIPEETLDTLLVSYGLERVCHSRWSNLTPCEERRLRLLGATYQSEKVLILNDPFDPISGQWRERFAELLSTFARTKRHIIVVTRLSTRPECWIDNETIARIQVGETIQKTIGFGSGPSAMNQLVSEVRELMRDEQKVKEFLESGSFTRSSSQKHETPVSENVKRHESVSIDNSARRESQPASLLGVFAELSKLALEYKKEASIGIFSLIAVLVGISLFTRPAANVESVQVSHAKETAKDPDPQLIPPPQRPLEEKIETVKDSANPVEPKKEAPPVEVEIPVKRAQEPPIQRAAFILDSYPSEIKTSILDAVQANYVPASNSIPSFKRTRQETNEERPREKKNQEAGELLKLLQAASNTAKDGASSPSPSFSTNSYVPSYATDSPSEAPSADSMTPEDQKREVIRQKFLEAIERAAEKRRTGGF